MTKNNPELVLKIYSQIKSALLYLQKYNIIHGDLCLNNILIDQNYSIKISDFGGSNLLSANKSHISA